MYDVLALVKLNDIVVYLIFPLFGVLIGVVLSHWLELYRLKLKQEEEEFYTLNLFVEASLATISNILSFKKNKIIPKLENYKYSINHIKKDENKYKSRKEVIDSIVSSLECPLIKKISHPDNAGEGNREEAFTICTLFFNVEKYPLDFDITKLDFTIKKNPLLARYLRNTTHALQVFNTCLQEFNKVNREMYEIDKRGIDWTTPRNLQKFNYYITACFTSTETVLCYLRTVAFLSSDYLEKYTPQKTKFKHRRLRHKISSEHNNYMPKNDYLWEDENNPLIGKRNPYEKSNEKHLMDFLFFDIWSFLTQFGKNKKIEFVVFVKRISTETWISKYLKNSKSSVNSSTLK